jgi:glutaredoxin
VPVLLARPPAARLASRSPYQEIDIEMSPEARAEMQQRSGRTSVPQIFVGDVHVGGCDDLHALEARGGLDPARRWRPRKEFLIPGPTEHG